MKWWIDLLLFIFLASLIGLFIYRLRIKLLKLWQEVTEYEVQFYKQLGVTLSIYNNHIDQIALDENMDVIRKIKKYRKSKIRKLILRERQDVFSALQVLHDHIEDREKIVNKPLIENFEYLQKVRRTYNTKVLLYNQTISVFPTRYLALKMGLELKEYFG
jgi:hypothetical protein